ncbi:MAG: sugar porter family MFS transporter [Cytophagaceae bacterium]
MKNTVILYAFVAALGGFLFGFDTAVISGAEQAIQRLWQLDSLLHGLAVAIALYGTVIGAMFSGLPADKFGRKNTLIIIALLYSISALGSALAPEVYSFMFFRFIGGLGVGASSVVAPMYISEISPAKSRGKLVMLFQLNIVIGIFLAYISNYLLEGIGGVNAWRWMMGMESIPALIFTGMTFFITESPRWLVLKKNDENAARSILKKISPGKEDITLFQIKESGKVDQSSKKLFTSQYKIPLMLAFVFAFFNQVSGINAIIYYAPRIFAETGLASEDSLLSTAGVGLFNMLFTILGMVLIDRAGRKALMYIGSVGMALTLGFVSYAFFTDSFRGVPPFIFAYIAFFAMSHGAVIWVFFSEIFPNVVRAGGQAFGGLTHWIFAAIIANLFPYSIEKVGAAPIFAFFSIMLVIQYFFVWKFMPETNGVSLEEIETKLGIANSKKEKAG